MILNETDIEFFNRVSEGNQPEETIVKVKQQIEKDLELIQDKGDLNKSVGSRLRLLELKLSKFYFSQGILNDDTDLILTGCYLTGRINYLSDLFQAKHEANQRFALVWDTLYSCLANDKDCLKATYRLNNSPSRYMYEVSALENNMRRIILAPDIEEDKKIYDIFTKKADGVYYENIFQLLRDSLLKEKDRFENDSLNLIKSYKRWAVANNKFLEKYLPIQALGLIRFCIEFCDMPIPDLSSINNFSVKNLNRLIESEFNSKYVDELSSLWPELFENINRIPSSIKIEEIYSSCFFINQKGESSTKNN
ncbi:MAG: hypothetical protein QNK23_08505 [Crocinitomicaceae bacterium]|nr:hypothetical protein [Crocinitomicaceae bacterium]